MSAESPTPVLLNERAQSARLASVSRSADGGLRVQNFTGKVTTEGIHYRAIAITGSAEGVTITSHTQIHNNDDEITIDRGDSVTITISTSGEVTRHNPGEQSEAALTASQTAVELFGEYLSLPTEQRRLVFGFSDDMGGSSRNRQAQGTSEQIATTFAHIHA